MKVCLESGAYCPRVNGNVAVWRLPEEAGVEEVAYCLIVGAVRHVLLGCDPDVEVYGFITHGLCKW
jgi:hypothetical protein